jgi:hypothetical protein
MTHIVLACILCGDSELPPPVAAAATGIVERFVRVSFWFGRDESGIPGEDKDAREEMADRYYDRAMSLRWYGAAIDAAGSVVCADPGLPLDRVVKIEGQYGGGWKAELALADLFIDYGALRLAPKEQPPAPLPHVEFAEPSFALGDPFYRADVVVVGSDRYVQFTPERVDLLPLGDPSPYRAFFGLTTEDRPFGGSLLLDRAGRAVGYQVDYDLWDGSGGLTTYHPRALRTGGRLSWERWRERRTAFEATLRRSLARVQIFLRNEKEEDEDDDGWYGGDEEAQKTITTYGLAIPGGRLLVPIDLERSAVRQIARITVGEESAAQAVPFIGAFLSWGGLLVGGVDGLEPLAIEAGAEPVRGRLFMTHRAEERFGRLFQETDYNRYYNVQVGRRDEEMLSPVKALRAPATLFDLEGRPIGLYVARRLPDRPTETRTWEQIVSLRQLAKELADPAPFLDPQAVPRPRREEKRPVWLGVEFQRVSRPLMEMRGLLGATREGRVGLMVSHVYRDSPAQRLGLAVGDILLSVKEEGQDRPTEFLNTREGRVSLEDSWGRSRWSGDDDGELEPYRIWRGPQNYLTAILTKIGPGKTVTLAWLHGDAQRQATLALEEGPDDFESAERWKDRVVGLTVRDLTYEVRDALRLAADAPGVVISAVEPGGPADVRQLRPYELVTHIDGVPLKKAADVRSLLEGRRGGRAELRVWTFGETRIVTIDVTPETEAAGE